MANANLNQGGTEPRRESPAGGHGRYADERRRRLAGWLATPAGGRLLDLERPALAETARRFLGDSLLWIGATADLVGTTAQCMVRARICTTCGTIMRDALSARESDRADMAGVDLVAADTAELPFAGASIDGVVLHHALDVAADRRGTLREAARILKPGGRLVVVGFNPLSLWLLSKPLPAFRDLRPLSVPRLGEWLTVLGMTRDAQTVYLNYRSALPVTLAGDRWQTASAWVNRLQPPLGGAYILAATKRGHGYILQDRNRRQHGRELAPAALPNAS
ncbi:MAG: class I SAM-dependent methyltransferase [Gammaproteobacteria bacterium]|nr:class I SAM-dependent methyltransferase [Gammaproteobacteria bacterium]